MKGSLGPRSAHLQPGRSITSLAASTEDWPAYSRLNLFSDYMRGKEARNIDVSWDVQINMTINKWLSASVSTNLIYDNDIKFAYDKKDAAGNIIDQGKCAKVQFKEVLALGLQYNF